MVLRKVLREEEEARAENKEPAKMGVCSPWGMRLRAPIFNADKGEPMKTDYQTVKVEVKDGAAVFELNNPPVNQLFERLVREMADAFAEAWGDPSIKAIILTETGKNFVAGVDITQIQPIKDKNFLLPRVIENNRFVNAIEEGPNR